MNQITDNKSDSIALALLWVTLLAPLLVLIGLEIAGLASRTSTSGDVAVLEVHALHALKGQALLGPYSRFLWSHPGPLYFYLLTPIYALAQKATYALHVSVLLANLIAVIGIARIHMNRSRNIKSALAIFPIMALYLVFIDGRFFPSGLASIWNPFVTILPFALLLLLCASFSTVTSARSLPLIMLIYSFLVQTHIAYFPAATFALLIGLAGMSVQAWRSVSLRRWMRDNRLYLGLASFISFICWTPTFIEEWRTDPGNLSNIATFFLSQPDSSGASLASLIAVRDAVSAGATGDLVTNGMPSTALTLVLICGLAAGVWVRRGNLGAYLSSLILLSCGGILVGLYSAGKIVGELHSYLLIWVSAFGLVLLITSVELLFTSAQESARTRRSHWLCLALTALLSIFTLQRDLAQYTLAGNVGVMPEDIDVARLEPHLASLWPAEDRSPATFRVGRHHRWPEFAGLVLKLYKQSAPIFVEDDWLFMFGNHMRPIAESDVEFWVTEDPQGRARLERFQDSTLMVSDDKCAESFEVAWGALMPTGGSLKGLQESAVMHGRMAPDASPWNGPLAAPLKSTESITFHNPGLVYDGVLLSADANDQYHVSLSHDGINYVDGGLRLERPGVGLRRGFVEFPIAGRWPFLRITGKNGDGLYSIGGVAAVQSAETFLDLGTHEAHKAFGYGWSVDETWPDGTTVRWALGHEATISVVVPPARSYVLRMRMNPAPLTDREQTVCLLSAEKKVACFVLEPSWATYETLIPYLPNLNTADLTLQLKTTLSRQERVAIGEERALSVAVDSISLRPCVPTPGK